MKIRRPLPSDLERMHEEGLKFLEFVMPGKDVDPEHLEKVLQGFIRQGICYIAEKDDRVIGAIGGLLSPNLWWPDEVDLVELFWWVQPEYRNSSAGLRLMKAFVDHGKNDDLIRRVVMHMETISPLNDDVFTKRGFELKEKAFVMEV